MNLDNLCLCLVLLNLSPILVCDAAENVSVTEEQSKGEDDSSNPGTENKGPEENQQSESADADVDLRPTVEYIQRAEDCKKRATPMDALQVHFSASVLGGMQLDSSYEMNKGEPLKVMLRKKKEMNPAEEVMLGLCEGDKIRMTVSARTILGDKKNVEGLPFPADSTLEYFIDMISITPPPLNEDTFEIIDADGDGQVSQEEFTNHLKEIGLETESHQMSVTYFEGKDTNKDNMITMEEMQAPIEDELESDEGKPSPDEGKSAPDERKAAPDEGKSAPDEGKSAPDEGKTAPDEGKQQHQEL